MFVFSYNTKKSRHQKVIVTIPGSNSSSSTSAGVVAQNSSGSSSSGLLQASYIRLRNDETDSVQAGVSTLMWIFCFTAPDPAICEWPCSLRPLPFSWSPLRRLHRGRGDLPLCKVHPLPPLALRTNKRLWSPGELRVSRIQGIAPSFTTGKTPSYIRNLLHSP